MLQADCIDELTTFKGQIFKLVCLSLFRQKILTLLKNGHKSIDRVCLEYFKYRIWVQQFVDYNYLFQILILGTVKLSHFSFLKELHHLWYLSYSVLMVQKSRKNFFAWCNFCFMTWVLLPNCSISIFRINVSINYMKLYHI